MENRVTFTHYGWFGVCPVVFGQIRELPNGKFDENSIPCIQPRWSWLEFWLCFSEWLVGLYISFRLNTDAFYVPTYPVVITGKFDKPLIREFPPFDE